MAIPADVVRGNDFPLNVHVSVWDDDLDAYVSYAMTGATDVRVWLVRDRDMSERLPLHLISVDGSVVTAMVPGRRVRIETYGVELSWTTEDHRSKRAFRRGLLRFLNCNDEQATPAQEECQPVTDVNIHINVDVESVDIGMDTVPAALVRQVRSNTEKLEGIEEGAEKNVQSSWNENNPDSDSYVRNRTHWEEISVLFADSPVLSWEVRNGAPVFLIEGTGWELERVSPIFHQYVGDGWSIQVWTQGDRISEVTIWQDGGAGEINVSHDAFPRIDEAGSLALYSSAPVTADGAVPFIDNGDGTHTPRLPYTGTTVHKLDNKYLDLDNAPKAGGRKPVTSGGVYEYLEDVVMKGEELGEIDPPGADFNPYSDTVWNKEQTLSQAQKDQVKENLGITCDENLSNLEIIDLLGL